MVWDKPKLGSVDRQVDGGDFKPASSQGGWVGANRLMSWTRVFIFYLPFPHLP